MADQDQDFRMTIYHYNMRYSKEMVIETYPCEFDETGDILELVKRGTSTLFYQAYRVNEEKQTVVYLPGFHSYNKAHDCITSIACGMDVKTAEHLAHRFIQE